MILRRSLGNPFITTLHFLARAKHYFVISEIICNFALAYAREVSMQEKHCYLKAQKSHAFLIVEPARWRLAEEINDDHRNNGDTLPYNIDNNGTTKFTRIQS